MLEDRARTGEKGLEEQLQPPALAEANGAAPDTNGTVTHLLPLTTALQTDKLPESQKSLVLALQHGLSTLADTTGKDSLHAIVNEPVLQPQVLFALP